MTLKPYTPENLDDFALRLLDVAAIVREMARRSRDSQLPELALNDKKAQEWLGKLEHWVYRAQADLDAKIRAARATRRAQVAGAELGADRNA